VVQGFGNVGGIAAQELAMKGAAVLAVSDISGGIYSESSLDLEAVRTWVADHSTLEGYPEVQHVTNAELLELPCDMLVLAALEDQLTAENAPRVDAKLVAEGANGPTSIEADAILAERGILVLPDVLTNAGGVTVSYFEWVQDLGRLFWTRDEIRARLAEKLGDAFDRVWKLAETKGISLRQAALVAGINEVAGALKVRGIYP
jgi:glutamate dehydrogenase (NAD(P)+)